MEILRFLTSMFVFPGVFLLLSYLQNGKKGIIKSLTYLFASFLLALILKSYFNIPRTCIEGAECFTDLRYPSGHSLFAFSLAFSLYPGSMFPIGLAYALTVAFSRVYYGLHSLSEVLASLSFSYGLFLFLYKESIKKGSKELGGAIIRKSLHITYGVLVIFSFLFFKDITESLLLIVSLGILIYNSAIKSIIPELAEFTESILNKGWKKEEFFGKGMLSFSLGSLSLLTYPLPQEYILFSLLTLTLADPLSFFINKGPRIFHTSIGGSLGFFLLSSLIGLYFGVPPTIPAVLTVVNAITDEKLDDNYFLPLTSLLLFPLFK